MLAASGIEYAGWLPNHRVPEPFSRARALRSQLLIGLAIAFVSGGLAILATLLAAYG